MKKALTTNESGMAVVTALLVLMLASGLMAGMFAALLANQQAHATDRDQSVAYAAAHAGLEKLTASLAGLFATNFSPTAEDLDELSDYPPEIAGFEYTAPDGGSGYAISFTPDVDGNPTSLPSTDITTGPFEGFKGLVTPYIITVTARSETGRSEVRLRRELQTVAVPVFQFGIFGEKSLGFHAGPNFDFGGRVHTNESLFLASGGANAAASTLTFRDKITAFTQVVRDRLMNGVSVTLTSHMGTVLLPRVIGGAANTYRALTYTNPNESSGTLQAPWSGWEYLSEETYHANIRTEATGAKRLSLPLTSQGAEPIDLIRRPEVNSDEDTEDAVVFGQRYFAQASLRILLSDRASDITDLPTIDTTVAPVNLADLVASGPYVVDMAGTLGKTPVAVSPGEDASNFAPATGLVRTRLGAVPGGTIPTDATLTIHTSNAAGTGSWDPDGVPNWLKAFTAGGNAVSFMQDAATAITCSGLNPTHLSGCPSLPNGARIRIFRGDGLKLADWTLGANYAANVNIPIPADADTTVAGTQAFTTALHMVATRTFFVGQDPVTCTGFTANTLTGCSWSTANNAALANSDLIYTGATTTAGTPLLHGFIKIERQDDDDDDWHDVTMEILNLGFTDRNQQGADCGVPSLSAILRFQRYRDNGRTAAAGCNYADSTNATDYWPNTIYDTREGTSRPGNTDIYAGGVMSYVSLDVGNFRQWVDGAIGTTGNLARENNGYIIYFSDRRGDHNEDDPDTADIETGEYGFEDSINPTVAAWTAAMTGRGTLETGEDLNEDSALATYGEDPTAVAGVVVGATAAMGFDSTSRPWTSIPSMYSGRGRLARPVLFRRALKLVNGGLAGGVNQLPEDGFTVTSENPVYVQGHYNASNETAVSAANSTTAWTTLAEPNRAAAIIADSITLLSGSFNDAKTFLSPSDSGNRAATSTAYRFAMTTGKAVPFAKPAAWGDQDTGSDGGVHNFMKYLENWGGQNVRYRGSMVSLYHSRQAVGIYRANADIYGAPANRLYNFDTDFLTPSLLPPGTPMFRDINTLKFRQILRPNQ